jgi:hypothetical protein
MESLAGDGYLAGERALFHGLYVRSNPAYGAAADASVLSVLSPDYLARQGATARYTQ